MHPHSYLAQPAKLKVCLLYQFDSALDTVHDAELLLKVYWYNHHIKYLGIYAISPSSLASYFTHTVFTFVNSRIP